MAKFLKYKGDYMKLEDLIITGAKKYFELIPEAVYKCSNHDLEPFYLIEDNKGNRYTLKWSEYNHLFIPSGIQEINWKNKDYKALYLKKLDREMELKGNYVSMTIQEAEAKQALFNEDKVNHPSHYTWLKDKCGIEVIDITRHLDFCTGNAVKYLLRAGHKDEKGYTSTDKTIEDLNKAIFYINDKIKQLKN